MTNLAARGIGLIGGTLLSTAGLGAVSVVTIPGLAFLTDVQRDPQIQSAIFAEAVLASADRPALVTDLDADPTGSDATAVTVSTDASGKTTTTETS